MHTTLIAAAALRDRLDDPAWAVVDCRFQLGDADAGSRAYAEGHVQGAVYAHLDRDLCAPIIPGATGRHPLPDPGAFARRLGELGIGNDDQVVAYDDAGGAMAAARFWWLLRWLGHDRVAVLDGGWRAWLAENGPVHRGAERRPTRTFVARVHPELVADARVVEGVRVRDDWRLLDARSAERFRGESETIDPVAGHIPGARSAPYAANLAPDGRLLPVDALRAHYAAVAGDTPPERIVCYCGSGVTAALNVLAMEHAGLHGARLYAGSWSDWILDPARAVATG
jgi:thiosulfate/3-mercaptopyruvate sulfurtransferase